MTDGEATDGQRERDKQMDRNKCPTNINAQIEAGGPGDRLTDGLPEGQKKTLQSGARTRRTTQRSKNV